MVLFYTFFSLKVQQRSSVRAYARKSFYFIFVFPVFALAQEYSLSGTIIGINDAPLPFSTVLLLDKDSVTVKGEYTDDAGKYSIGSIKPATYILKVSSLGYKTQIAEIAINEDVGEYRTVLEQESLDEVVVTAKQPKIERKLDGIVFNVENTTLSEGTVWNALSKTPYLSETGGELLIKGRETPVIFINDKRVYLSSTELKQLLENTPATTLKKVEVILTPPAKYDADGKTIVNIVMDKNLSVGYNGNLSGAYIQGVYPKYQLSTAHFYKTDKINIYALYSHSIRKIYRFFSDEINFFTDDMLVGNWLSETQSAGKLRNHNLNTNIDYTISDNQTLSLSGIVSFVPSNSMLRGSDTKAYNNAKQVDSSFYSTNRASYLKNSIALSLDYTYEMGEGKKITANVHHTSYNSDNDQTLITNYFDADYNPVRNNSFTNDNDEHVKIYTAQADYNAPAKKNGAFETGAKWTSIDFENDIVQMNITGENVSYSDRFLYKENTFAAYMSYEKNWEQWDLRLGLRGENTAIEGVSFLEGTNRQNYFKIFPAVHLSYKHSDNHRFTVSYGKKIGRPQFNKLNPFKMFLNDNAYITGNPDLLPTIEHKIDFIYNLKESLSLDFYLRRADNYSLQLSFVDNENNKLVYVEDNLDKNVGFGLDILWNKEITSWWSFDTFSAVFYDQDNFFATQNSATILKNKRWATFHRFTNNFTLSKDRTFIGDIGLMYISKVVSGNATIGAQSNLSMSLRKTLWNRRATLSFSANDIFNELAYPSRVRYLDQSINSYSNFERRTFEMRITYRFGNYKLRNNRKDIDKEERERLNSDI